MPTELFQGTTRAAKGENMTDPTPDQEALALGELGLGENLPVPAELGSL
jgi:hypothetical protein